MSSINTNTSAMNALSTLRGINKNLETTQGRISTGLKVQSGKDNAAYFSISETMSGDSSVYSSINEGLTLTKNSIATARLGAETFQDLAQQFQERVAFAQGAEGGMAEVAADLDELIKQMETTIQQSTFNGDDMVNAAGVATSTASAINVATGSVTATVTPDSTRKVVTGVSRSSGDLKVTQMTVNELDLSSILSDFKALASNFQNNAESSTNGEAFLAGALASSNKALGRATDAATELGQAEKSIEGQQEFLTALVDNIESGVGAMIDADMEEEAARLQALQVQQQLATQSLSIANSSPQSILSLFQ